MGEALQTLVNVLAVPTFALLIWQILRNEWTQRPEDLVTRLYPVEGHVDCVRITCTSPNLPAYDARFIPLSNAVIMDDFSNVTYVPVLEDSDEILDVVVQGKPGKATPMLIMITASRQTIAFRKVKAVGLCMFVALRSEAHDGEIPVETIDTERWKWSRIAWMKRLANKLCERLHIRKRFHLGRFHSERTGAGWWKSEIPHEDWMRPSKLPNGVKKI